MALERANAIAFLTLVRGGRDLWVTIDGSGAIERRSGVDGRSLGRVTPGGAPHDLALEPRGRRVWLSNWDSGSLTVVSSGSGRAVRRIPAGVEPHHFAFTAQRAWASDNGIREGVYAGPPPEDVRMDYPDADNSPSTDDARPASLSSMKSVPDA